MHVRGHRWQASPLALMPWQMLLGALALAPVAALLEPEPKIDWSPELLTILFYNGPIASAFLVSSTASMDCSYTLISPNRGCFIES